MIYVPNDNIYNKCYVIQSEGVIRAYDTTPRNNTSYNYRDYYIRTDYMFKDGTGNWSNMSNLPVCISSSNITHEVYYRYDFDKILIIFILLVIIMFKWPLKLILRLFRRFL